MFKANLIQDFEQEYTENSDVKTWVISSEHLHSRLSKIKMIKQVKQFLSNKFDEIEILVHLRPQVDIAVSLASTAARVGKIVNSTWFYKQKTAKHYYNYNQLIKKWESVFGDHQIKILPFNQNPCMTSFLIHKLGIKVDGLTAIERKNEAIDWRAMALFNPISELKEGQSFRYFINDLPFTEKLEIGLDLAQKFQSEFEQSNTQLIHRRPELNIDDLTPDWSKYDVPANLFYLDSPPLFTEQLNFIMMRFHWEIKLEQCNTNLAECERALAQNNLKEGRIFLKNAQKIVSQIPEYKTIIDPLEQVMQRIESLAQQVR